MSWKTDAYLRQLRPMDGQQADRPETEPVERPTTETPMLPHRSQPAQQPLFAGDSSVLFAAFDAFMQDGEI